MKYEYTIYTTQYYEYYMVNYNDVAHTFSVFIVF